MIIINFLLAILIHCLSKLSYLYTDSARTCYISIIGFKPAGDSYITGECDMQYSKSDNDKKVVLNTESDKPFKMLKYFIPALYYSFKKNFWSSRTK